MKLKQSKQFNLNCTYETDFSREIMKNQQIAQLRKKRSDKIVCVCLFAKDSWNLISGIFINWDFTWMITFKYTFNRFYYLWLLLFCCMRYCVVLWSEVFTCYIHKRNNNKRLWNAFLFDQMMLTTLQMAIKITKTRAAMVFWSIR